MAINEKAWKVGFRWTKGDESNPTGALALDDTSKALHICEIADAGTDWNVAVDSHPSVYIHSASTPATDYIKMYHDADIGYVDVVGGTTLRLLIAGTSEIDLTASAFSPAVTNSNALGTTALMWSDLFLASGGVINFNNGDMTLTHSANVLTFEGGDTYFGVDATGIDVRFYGDTTKYNVWFDYNGDTNGAWYFGADDYGIDVGFYGQTISRSMLWDASGDELTFTGSGFTMGSSGTPARDFVLYGTQAGAKVWLDVDGDTNGAFYFGANDYGIDVGFYGATITNSMIWDASADALVFTAGGITMGTTSKLVIPVKASGSTTSGDVWLDTTDNYIHYYTAGKEYSITGTA